MRNSTIVAVLAMVSALSAPLSLMAEERGYWPSDADEERLKGVDAKLLEVQKARFQAIMGSDEAKAEKLSKKFKSVQKERRNLLRATGRR